MNPTIARTLRIAVELLVIAAAVAALVTTIVYAWEAPYFDHPHRGENAKRNFVTGSVVLSAPAAVAVGVLWLVWRRRAALDAQLDAPARVLAAAVATLPEVRRDREAAMMAELSSVTDSTSRWRFAASSARAALFPPAGGRRPATGWLGAAVAVLGVIACVLAYPGTVELRSVLFIAILVVFSRPACPSRWSRHRHSPRPPWPAALASFSASEAASVSCSSRAATRWKPVP